MENLTHTLVGLMMARCGLEKTGVRGAGMMMLAANIPDIDGVSWLGGNTTYLTYHRGPTHTLILAPVMALLPILLVRAKITWRAWIASTSGVLSHLVVDWLTSFGIPLLWPFSPRRWRLDLFNLIDVWVWVILLGALAATYLAGLVNREIGDRKGSGGKHAWAAASLLFFFGYGMLRMVSHQRAIAMLSEHLYDGAPPKRVTALPGAVNPFQWRTVVEAGESPPFVEIGLIRVVGDTNGLPPPRRYPVTAHTPEMDAALTTRPFRIFSEFSQLPYWQVSPAEGGAEVALTDLRFADPGRPGFGTVRVFVGQQGRVEVR